MDGVCNLGRQNGYVVHYQRLHPTAAGKGAANYYYIEVEPQQVYG
jgi:hypothetical protein